VCFLGGLVASGEEAAGLLELRRAGEAAGAARPLLPPETECVGGGLSEVAEAAGALLRPCEGCSGWADNDKDAAPPDEQLAAADPPLLHALLGCSAIEARLAPACTQHYTIHTWAAINQTNYHFNCHTRDTSKIMGSKDRAGQMLQFDTKHDCFKTRFQFDLS
jgi:hypothetical protein